MSLKGFHVVFVTASALLALGFGVWCFTSPLASSAGYRVAGAVAMLAAIGLVIYGFAFYRKISEIQR
jgi:hypothetical protein|tara:strand:- start:405 stop:605 length:201 start_codon:yes stop_codon:yes gene_type:complete